MSGGTPPNRSRRRVKQVLASVIAIAAIGSVTVRGVWGLYSGEVGNRGSSISTGTLTLNNRNSVGASASTTLSANVGVTTLNGSISAATTSITVSSATSFPGSGPYTIVVDNEEMTVTAGFGTTTWTVTRGVNGTQAASHSSSANVYQVSIGVASASGFPTTGDYTILVGSERMMVTGGQGTTTWTVTRAVDGTSAASHASAAAVATNTCRSIDGTSNVNSSCDSVLTFSPAAIAAQTTLNGGITSSATSITVASGTGFANGQIVVIDSEAIQIVSGGGTTSWTVTRAVDGTTAVSHSNNAYVSHQTLGEDYPGMPVTTWMTITDSGSINATDLDVYMPSCLRGITPDSPIATSVPAAPTFGSAASTGGYLAGGTTYYYEITAVSASGESVAGGEASYTPPLGTNTNTIKLNWTAVAGATSYKIYRATSEGSEALLDTSGTNSYTDSTATSPSGSPPAGTGSGNPCVWGNGTSNGGFYVQETDASGNATQCWYPDTNTSCTFDGTIDLGLFASVYNTLGQSLDLGAGPTATNRRYFTVGFELPANADNSLQDTEALFTLNWYARQS